MAFCPYSTFISSVFVHIFLDFTDKVEMEQYHQEFWANSQQFKRNMTERHGEDILKTVLLVEERLCEFISSFKHLYDVTVPRPRDSYYRTAGTGIKCKLDGKAKEKCEIATSQWMNPCQSKGCSMWSVTVTSFEMSI